MTIPHNVKGNPTLAGMLAHDVAIRAYWKAIRDNKTQDEAREAYELAKFDALASLDSTAPEVQTPHE